MIVNKVGLRKRESYDEIVNYIQTDKTKIKYPDRKATFLMRTNQFLSLLDTDGLEEQEQSIEKQKVAGVLARNLASSSGGTEALVRPNQLALVETERNASAYAAGQRPPEQQQQPANLLSRLWRGARGSSSSSGSNLRRTNEAGSSVSTGYTGGLEPIVKQGSRNPAIFDLFDHDDDIASEADDIDEFLDANEGEVEDKKSAAAEMGRQHLEEVHQQHPINSYLNKLYSKSNDVAENRKRKTEELNMKREHEQMRTNDTQFLDQLTQEQSRKKATASIGLKFYKQSSWLSQPIKVLDEQMALRDINLYTVYKNSKVKKTTLQIAREIIEWDQEHFPAK